MQNFQVQSLLTLKSIEFPIQNQVKGHSKVLPDMTYFQEIQEALSYRIYMSIKVAGTISKMGSSPKT